MTFDPRLERALPDLLADLGSGGQPDYADAILARTARVRQRPAWTFAERWLPMDSITLRFAAPAVRWRLLALVLLLIVALVAAAIVSVSGTRRDPHAPFGPARNGAIAVSSAGDIAIADVAGGLSKPLISGPEFDFRPGFSPDGSRIAFLRRVHAATDGLTALVVARADGSGAVVVTTDPLQQQPTWWAWTPDSLSIAVLASRGDFTTIEVYDALAAHPPRVLDPKMTIDGPSFRPPDGRQILFRGKDVSGIGLYTMNADGSNVQAIVAPYVSAHEEHDLLGAAWSPDATRIVLERATAGGDVHLELINADGSGAREVGFTPGDVLDAGPKWSPDGTQILFARMGSNQATYAWAVVDVASGAIRQVGPTIDQASGSGMVWSPDGKRLLGVIGDGRKPFFVDPLTGAVEELPWGADTADWQASHDPS